MAINTSGILKSPQGSAIQNAEIIFEQTRTSTEVLAGTKFSVITNQTGNYSSSLGVGTYVFKVRFQDETQYRTVASNVIVTQSMNNYSLNQIIQDQSQLQEVDYNLLQDVIQARDQAAASKQAAQSSQATASTKASEASSSAQAALASKNAAQTSEANALASKNAAQTSQTNAASSQTAAANSQTTSTTKATEASNSAQAALASKNAAQTSETNALASKNAAQTSQTNAASSQAAAAGSQTTASTKASQAATSQTQAQQSQSDAGSAASQADSSAQQAQQSQTSASTSQTTATTKASEASSSAQAALASKNAAQTSETNALSSKNAAQTSQTNAASSQTAASTSQTTASTKAGEASTSQTNAAASQATATTKAGEASTSQTNAATSQATATTKAGEASTSQTNAAASQATATTKATEAASSTTLAQKWAANPENSVVSGGLYSALHYATKAAQSAKTASGQLVWRGGWSAQAGTAPPNPNGLTQDFYRITQAGTILSVQYEIGDYIHWDNINSIWFKMDGTDSVTSVNGRTGAVVVTKTDVGLSAVNNWAASSQTNDASTTTYATTAGVKAAYDLAATKLAATANAVSATKLVTARTINGTNFDGTVNITTQNWGTSRNLTIGETSKAVNGSADTSWTLNEIGAAPAGFGLGVTQIQKVAQDQTEGGFWRDAALNLAGITMPYDGSPSQAFLAVNVLSNTLRFGKRTGATSVAITWYDVYSTNNKPTAADLSVVPDTRTVNGKRLNANVTLVPQDLGTLTTSEIEALGRKSITINQPAGLVQGKYYPIVVTNYYNDQALYITTRSSGGSDPMNNCSFDGIVRQAGWSDKSSIVDGVFTAYSSSERAIHSIVGPSEQEGVYAIYVEARQFPVVVRVQGSQTVQCTGANISYGTSTFVAQVDNPSTITGATNKLNMLADFAKGSGRYRGGSLYYHEGNKPTPADIGALQAGATAVAATKLETARTIGGVAFDGTANINLPGVNIAGNQSTTGNAATATQLATARTIGGVAFDGTANINLPGVNTTGNQSTTGNAATATKLATARTISGVAFDGTANITLTAENVGALPITGGTLTGGLLVNASVNAGGLFSTSSITANTTASYSGIRLSSNGTGYSEIVPRRAGEADFVWSNGIRYYNSGNYWAIGVNKIYHEAFKPTAVDVGALPITGGTLTGNITAPDFIQSSTQSTNAAACTRKDYVDSAIAAGDALQVSKSGDTMTGALIITKDDKAIILNPEPNTASYILGQQGGVASWYIGKGSKSSDDITLNSFTHSTSISLASDRINVNKNIVTSAAQSSLANSLTRKDYVDGLAAGKLGSTTNTVWNATGAGAGQGLAYSGKTAIGGVNDSWLRINPNSEFTSGIYCGASLLRTDGSFSVNDYSPTRRSIRLAPGGGGGWNTDKIAYIDLGGAPTTGSTATHLLRYKDTAGATIFALETLDQGGQTYLRAGTGNYQFNTNGEFNASGNGNFNDVYIRSDKRLKSNLVKLGGALDRVGQLQAYSYDKHKSLTDRTVVAREVGLVAQDVMVVIPEAVKAVSHQISGTTTEEVLTISSSAINAVLVEALKELMEKVTALEARIKEVENVGT